VALQAPTIGNAYAATLAFSPDLLGIFLIGSSTENRTSQYQFLADRCSKEFLALYLEQDPDILSRISEPSPELCFLPRLISPCACTDLAYFPRRTEKRFIGAVTLRERKYTLWTRPACEMFSLTANLRTLFRECAPTCCRKLAVVRGTAQSNHDSSQPPDEHMRNILESFSTLKKRFSEDADAVKIIERETDLANDLIAETEPPDPKVSPRTLGPWNPLRKCTAREVSLTILMMSRRARSSAG
jgi:hypothetical protein